MGCTCPRPSSLAVPKSLKHHRNKTSAKRYTSRPFTLHIMALALVDAEVEQSVSKTTARSLSRFGILQMSVTRTANLQPLYISQLCISTSRNFSFASAIGAQTLSRLSRKPIHNLHMVSKGYQCSSLTICPARRRRICRGCRACSSCRRRRSCGTSKTTIFSCIDAPAMSDHLQNHPLSLIWVSGDAIWSLRLVSSIKPLLLPFQAFRIRTSRSETSQPRM